MTLKLKTEKMKEIDNSVDFVKLGIIKRRLTRDEAEKIVSEVMSLGLNDVDSRIALVIIKAIEVTNQKSRGRCGGAL